MNRKSITALLTCTLFVTITCNTLSQSNPESAPPDIQNLSDVKWETYEDQDYGFSISYPSTWYFFRSQQPYDELTGGKFVLFSSTLGNTSIQSRSEDEEARLTVSINNNPPGMDVEGWLVDSPLMDTNPSRPVINGLKGIRIITASSVEEDPSENISLFLVTPNYRYSLVGIISPSNNSTLWSEVVLHMQDSFKTRE